jgi:hypothetical protein
LSARGISRRSRRLDRLRHVLGDPNRFFASWLIAPGMDGRADVYVIWLAILVMWLAVWRVRATK